MTQVSAQLVSQLWHDVNWFSKEQSLNAPMRLNTVWELAFMGISSLEICCVTSSIFPVMYLFDARFRHGKPGPSSFSE